LPCIYKNLGLTVQKLFQIKLKQFNGVCATHFNFLFFGNYVSVIKDIYAQQFARLDGNTALAIKVLNAIASGCKDATASYVE
jgi:hypothetical protein